VGCSLLEVGLEGRRGPPRSPRDARLEITALMVAHLSTVDAEDFLEVYKGVVPEYRAMVPTPPTPTPTQSVFGYTSQTLLSARPKLSGDTLP